MLRLALLGPPSVECDGAPAVFDTRKSIALLAMLAVDRRERSRESLSAAMWPDSDDTRARSSLRRTLSVTAAAVGPALRITRTTAGLDPALVWCDLWEYTRLAELDDVESLALAAGLYREDFLAGFRARAGAEFEHWQELVAEEQRQRLGRILDRLVCAESAAGEVESGLGHARRWLALDELHEPAHRALMRMLARSGQRAAALEQYRRCVRVLEQELGVAPLEETTQLYQTILENRFAEPSSIEPVEAPGGSGGSVERETFAHAVLPRQERVVDALVAEVREADEPGRVAVLSGPSGSGKSWLLDILRRRVDTDRHWVFARCHDGERSLELGCVTELLRSAFAVRSNLRDDLSTSEVRELARLVPDLAGRPDPPPAALESPGAQVRFFRAVAATLAAAVVGPTPGMIVVDDVDHVDETSAGLLGYVVRRIGELPGLLVLTWAEDADVPVTLLAALADAERRGRVSRLQPPKLDRDDVTAVMSAKGLSGADAERLLEETGGLALLVAAYADELSAGAETALSNTGHPNRRAVPTSARHLFAERLSRATEVTGQVLQAAAVLGAGFDADLLRATSGRSPAEVADALDEALARGLVAERPATASDAHAYEFRFEGLRQVVEESIGSARRRLLHARAADALERRAETTATGSVSSAVASHLAEAGRREEAAAWAWKSAQRSLSLFAHAEALDHLRQADAFGYRATEVRLAIADVLVALGRYREASAELESAAASVDPREAGVGAVIEHRLASVHERLGNWPAAAAHTDAALALADGDSVLRARLAADRAFIAYQCGEAAAAELAAQALADAKGVGDVQALAQAYNVSGMIASLAGDLRAGEAWLRTSLDLARDLPEPSASVAALNNLAKVLHESGRTGEALELAAEALRRGVEHGDVHRAAALHSNFADLLHAVGRTAESIEHLKESASGFASVDTGDDVRPGIWTLTRW